MKKDPEQTSPSATPDIQEDTFGLLDQAWDALDAMPSADFGKARQDQFWCAFEDELGAVEKARKEETAAAIIEQLPQLPVPAYTQAHEQRFWQAFTEELGAEEAHRQRQHQRKSAWEAFWQPGWTSWFSVATMATACLFVMITSPSKPIEPTPTRSIVAKHPTPRVTPLAKSQAPAPKKAQAAPVKLADVYKHYQMVRQLELLEHMDMLQQLPQLQKGKGS